MEITFGPQLELALRILLAAACGAAIGYERENRMKTAGIRTHLIVSIAAALMMIVSKYGFFDVAGEYGIGLDPSRIAAGAVTAIGFLGAGVIFVRKQNISGLTTAAGIWATVGVGISIGAGMYFIGILVSVLIILVQVLLHKHSRLVKEPMSEQIVLRISREESIEDLFDEIFESHKIEIVSLKARKLIGCDDLELRLYVKYPDVYEAADIIKLLREVPNIRSIEI